MSCEKENTGLVLLKFWDGTPIRGTYWGFYDHELCGTLLFFRYFLTENGITHIQYFLPRTHFCLVISCLPRSELIALQINGNADFETPGLVSVQACLSPRVFIIENGALSWLCAERKHWSGKACERSISGLLHLSWLQVDTHTRIYFNNCTSKFSLS